MRTRALPKQGEVIAGKYRIERQVGNGGMGAVFEATNLDTEKRVAIKWLMPDSIERLDSVKRFIREAKIAGRIDHPNVLDIYDLCREGDSLFLVMELLSGEPLNKRIERETRLSVSTACRVLLECLDGVAALHAATVIHRDLKPANIFICKPRGRDPERAKVLDFGVSRLQRPPDSLTGTTSTVSGALVGTVHYIAPEQLTSKSWDQRVDVYALGVTLFEALSGHRPFEAETLPQLLVKIATHEPTPLNAVLPGIPPALEAIVARAIQRDPDERFGSVQAFAAALEEFQASSLMDTHSNLSRALPAPATGKPRRAALVWLGLTAAGVAGALSVWTLTSKDAAPDSALPVLPAPVEERAEILQPAIVVSAAQAPPPSAAVSPPTAAVSAPVETAQPSVATIAKSSRQQHRVRTRAAAEPKLPTASPPTVEANANSVAPIVKESRAAEQSGPAALPPIDFEDTGF